MAYEVTKNIIGLCHKIQNECDTGNPNTEKIKAYAKTIQKYCEEFDFRLQETKETAGRFFTEVQARIDMLNAE